MYVHSPIGSYKIISPAITANKKNNTHLMEKYTTTVTEKLAGVAALPAYLIAEVLQARTRHGGVFCLKKHNTKIYDKYDFSGFDN